MKDYGYSTINSRDAVKSSNTPAPFQPYRNLGKRLFDLTLVVLMLPVVLSVLTLLILAIRRDGGPGLYWQERIGRNGVRFRCWKLRTMVVNADDLLERLCASDPVAAQEWRDNHKLTNDPRITTLGQFLRTTSLDELPQIFNVLLGEMSFIGPRPVTEAELERYGANLQHVLSVRPGISGLWQVSGRNDTGYDRRVALDAQYVDQLSLKTDLLITLKTFLVMVKRTGY
ncbi:sugar transferase [Aliiroseovarius sp. KMU-50]|uniref:Sugar transferase n=1 Tax=Aliiroseovarius salicola TaxID=3009082 RepID=A0ABT4VZ98_9RHOB|nr:sugar transferase [Aliiroseovarius sp. KMU-50]MDA5093055.1 sugar transferase [Aliiroseovarius sp. KMU-50]